MKRSHIIVGLIGVSWLASGAAWLGQKAVANRERAQQQASELHLGGDRRAIFAPGSNWKPAPKGIYAAATGSITAQLQAFKRDDFAAGIKLQSATLQKNFPSTAQFRAMLKQNYPQFAKYKTVVFRDVRVDPTSKRVAARVLLTGMDNISVRAVYFLVRQGQGFVVDGVFSRGAESHDFHGRNSPMRSPQVERPHSAPPQIPAAPHTTNA